MHDVCRWLSPVHDWVIVRRVAHDVFAGRAWCMPFVAGPILCMTGEVYGA